MMEGKPLRNGNIHVSVGMEGEARRTWRERIEDGLKSRRAGELLRKMTAETMASFFMMLFVCGLTMDNVVTDANMNFLMFGIAAGLGITVIIFAFGHISGAHVNPAVTIGFASVGSFPWLHVPLYILAQIVGGVLGCLVGRAFYSVHLGVTMTLPQTGVLKAFGMEIIIAMGFMFLASAVSSNAQVTGLHASVAVASSIALNIVVAGPISGASMNPMRSFAPALVLGEFKHIWIYLIAPPLGAVVGAWSYKLLTAPY